MVINMLQIIKPELLVTVSLKNNVVDIYLACIKNRVGKYLVEYIYISRLDRYFFKTN